MSIETVTQVTRPAAGAPALKTTGVSSVFTLGGQARESLGKGSASETKPQLKPRMVLLQVIYRRAGVWTRDELRSACSELNAKQFCNAITVSKVGGFIRKVGAQFEITEKGHEALRRDVDAAGADAKFRRSRKSGNATAALAKAPLKVTGELSPGFRVAIFSDGTFCIEKDSNRIELSNAEFQVMHSYTANL